MAVETVSHVVEAASHGGFNLVLLGAAVVAVPLFKRLGLGSVVGYLAAGLAIGPFGIGLFSDPQANVRRRDAERFALEAVDDIYAGRDLMHGNAPAKDQSVAEREASS